MKTGVIVLLLFFFCNNLKAQENKLRQTICLLDYVPLLIESEPVIYKWNKHGQFQMGPGRISIKLAARKIAMEFDHLIQERSPLPFQRQALLNFFLSSDSLLKRERKLSGLDFNLAIVDTVLAMGESLYLNWKDSSGSIIQQIGFTVHPLLPQVLGFRVSQFYDSIDHSHKAKRIRYNKSIPIGYQELNGDRIDIDPGGKLELKLQTHSLLTDTVVYYRINNVQKIKDEQWKMTGHILALPELVEGNAYELELRYPNQQEQITYHLNVRPYWYQIIWVRVSALILLVAIAVFITRFFYQRRLRKVTEQRKRLQERLTTLQSQLNPHFIFNSINSIEGLIMEENTQEANHYLSIFSAIMREALKNSDKTLVSLEEEIALMEKYIQIEQLRFGFQYSIQIAETIASAEIEVPPMLLQPVIENAVKHGASTLGEKGWIKIEVSLSGTSMLICISNNAAEKKSSQPTAGGYGLILTKQKIQHLKALFPSTPIEFSLDVAQGEAKAVFIFQDWMA